MRATVRAVVVVLALAGSVAGTEPVTIVTDGHSADWGDAAPRWTDAAGDGAAIDILRAWVESDSERVAVRFELAAGLNLLSGNSLTLAIDGDGDVSTGLAVHGIGAELLWTFGAREGRVFLDERETRVTQSDVGLRQAPTVSSDAFEISLLRRAVDGTRFLQGPHASFVLVDEGSPAGDRLPDAGSVSVELSEGSPPSPLPVSLERRDANDIRVLTWNVLFDGLFKRPAPFIRVLRAIDPDVICLQELWAHTARQAADQVSLALPDTPWYGGATAEGHIVSRYPFIEERAVDDAGNYWAVIDLPDDRYDVDLSVVSAHPPCCDNEEGRQRELDGIAAWLRGLVAGEGGLPEGTPIVVAGDMNLVGGARQVRTLLAGEIADEETFGPSHPSDWDGTPLADAEPRHAGGLDTFTWRDGRSSFAPGRLDYIVYSDSVLDLANAFVLATEELGPESLKRYALHPLDTLDASDHLPVVADFSPAAWRARTGRAE